MVSRVCYDLYVWQTNGSIVWGELINNGQKDLYFTALQHANKTCNGTVILVSFFPFRVYNIQLMVSLKKSTYLNRTLLQNFFAVLNNISESVFFQFSRQSAYKEHTPTQIFQPISGPQFTILFDLSRLISQPGVYYA